MTLGHTPNTYMACGVGVRRIAAVQQCSGDPSGATRRPLCLCQCSCQWWGPIYPGPLWCALLSTSSRTCSDPSVVPLWETIGL